MSWGARLVGFGNALELFEDVRVRYEGETVYVVGPTVEYAVYQDRGTSSIEARPFVAPAAERVQANHAELAGRFLDGPPTEESVVRATALAVEREMKQIVTDKDIIDTGALRASITTEKIR